MVRLRAYQPYDASVVIEHEGKLLFAERPYAKNLIVVSDSQLAYLLRRMEYVELVKDFPSLDELEGDVYRLAAAHRSNYPESRLTEEELVQGYEAYSEEMLEFLLEDTLERFVLADRLRESKQLLDAFWRVRKITNHQKLRSKLLDLQAELDSRTNPYDEMLRRPRSGQFPNLEAVSHPHLAGFSTLAA